MRIRSIKPDFWSSRDITDLSIEDRLLFIGLWSYVDDNGVGRDEEDQIVATLFARDMFNSPRETIARVADGLQRLSDAGLIVRYKSENRSYLEIVSWEKHQKIDRPNKARFPRYNADRDTLATHSRDYRETPSPGTEEQGNRGTDIPPCSAPPSDEGPNTPEPDSVSRKRSTPKRQATRLPEGWQPTPEAIAWAQREHPHVNLHAETARFKDHWAAESGAKARKVDWTAAWRNWIRNSERYQADRRGYRNQAQIQADMIHQAHQATAAMIAPNGLLQLEGGSQ